MDTEQNSKSLVQVKNEIIEIIDQFYVELKIVSNIEDLKFKQGCIHAYEYILESLEKIN